MNIPEMPHPEPGDTICVLVGEMNPPTMDDRRAADAILLRPEFAGLWMCPLSGDEHVRNMCTIFAAEYAAATSKLVTLCTAALDKELADPGEAMAWIRSKYGQFKFRVASTSALADTEPPCVIRFSGNTSVPAGTTPIVLNKFTCVGDGIRQRIASGKDESKNLMPGVWGYIQKHKLYRI